MKCSIISFIFTVTLVTLESIECTNIPRVNILISLINLSLTQAPRSLRRSYKYLFSTLAYATEFLGARARRGNSFNNTGSAGHSCRVDEETSEMFWASFSSSGRTGERGGEELDWTA